MRKAQALLAAMVALALLPSTASAANVATWGLNGSDALGDGLPNTAQTFSDAPVQVSGITEATQVSSAGWYDLARLSNGTVQAWGGLFTYSDVPLTVPGVSSAVEVSAGADALIRLSNEAVDVWSGNITQAPQEVAGLSGVAQVSSASVGGEGAGSDAALLTDGTVRTWGADAQGQLGDGKIGEENKSAIPVPVCTVNEYPCAPPNYLRGVKQIAEGGGASHDHVLALMENGEVKAWGGNVAGELGDGSTERSAIPVTVSGLSGVVEVAASGEDSYARLSDGEVKAWGDNYWGELGDGQGHTQESSDVPVAVSGINTATAISAGDDVATATIAGGAVESWGTNEWAALGYGKSTGPESCSFGGEAEKPCAHVPVKVQGLTGAKSGVAHAALASAPTPLRLVVNRSVLVGALNTHAGTIALASASTANGSADLHGPLSAALTLPAFVSRSLSFPAWGTINLYGQLEALEALHGTLDAAGGTTTASAVTRLRLRITQIGTQALGFLPIPRSCTATFAIGVYGSQAESEVASELHLSGQTEVPSISCPGQSLMAQMLSAGLSGPASLSIALRVTSHET